jgi:hypothetical protein
VEDAQCVVRAADGFQHAIQAQGDGGVSGIGSNNEKEKVLALAAF